MGSVSAHRESQARVPRYVCIAEDLIGQIEAGQLRPGDRLPPERELCRRLDVNRLTLRQAFGVLKARGLLVQRQGAGTYIAAPKIDRAAGRLWPFSMRMQSLGYAPTARLLLFECRACDAASAESLGIAVGAPVYHGHRVRLLGRDPVVLERFVLPAARFPGLERHDLASRSIYGIMAEEYGVAIAQARQSLEAVAATPYEAEALGVASGAPLMLEQRVTVDRQGQPIEYGKDLYRGDRFRFVTAIASLDDHTSNQEEEHGHGAGDTPLDR